MKLFLIRQIIAFLLLMMLSVGTKAQLVDEVLGQKRSQVSVLMRPHRIVDYKLERVVHAIGDGIHQTVFFENDTCHKFYWAVPTTVLPQFRQRLLAANYVFASDTHLTKDSLLLLQKPLETGNATLFIALLTPEMKQLQGQLRKPLARRERKGQQTKAATAVTLEPMPLLQQAILEQEADTTAKPRKDPERHWIGTSQGTTRLLGW